MGDLFILEDDDDIREIVGWILESEGYNVVSFENVSNFKSRDVKVLPDLFILDVMLPDGSGLEVCRQLKLDRDHNHIPVMMMSAHANISQVNRECSANGFIQKPFDIDSFMNKVRDLIQI